jgi:hypothetical protein
MQDALVEISVAHVEPALIVLVTQQRGILIIPVMRGGAHPEVITTQVLRTVAVAVAAQERLQTVPMEPPAITQVELIPVLRRAVLVVLGAAEVVVLVVQEIALLQTALGEVITQAEEVAVVVVAVVVELGGIVAEPVAEPGVVVAALVMLVMLGTPAVQLLARLHTTALPPQAGQRIQL